MDNAKAAFDQYLQDKDAQQVAPAAAALELAPGNPDQTANDIRLAGDFSKLTGNPPPPTAMVATDRPAFERVITRARNSTMLYGAPVLSSWVRDPDNAALAKDDLSNLSWWEGGLRAAGAAGARGTIRATQQVPQQFLAEKAAQRALDQGKSFGQILEDEQAQPGLLSPNNPLAMISSLYGATNRYIGSAIASATGEDNAASAAYRLGKVGEVQQTIAGYQYSQAGQGFKLEYEATQKANADKGYWEQLVALGQTIANNPGGAAAFFSETAAESVPTLAASTAVTALTRNPELGAAFMGGTSYTQERYTSPAEYFQSKGFDLTNPESVSALLKDPSVMKEAAQRGNIRGLIIGVLDGLSGGVAGKELARNPVADMFLQSVTQAAMGGGGEALAQLATDGKLDMSQVLAEALAEFVTAPAEAAGVGGRMFMNQRRKAEAARARVGLMAEISAQAQQSKTRERIPEKFQEYLSKAMEGSDAEHIYMPADKFVELFQSNGIDPYEAASDIAGISQGDIDRALTSGDSIRIPTAAYAAKIAGTEFDQAFMENSTFVQGGMTLAEATDFEARMNEHMADMAQEIAQARADEEAARPLEQEVYDTMVTRLRQAGRSTDVATTEALLWPAFYRAIAEKTAKTVQDVMASFPLPQVQGAIPQGIQLREPDALAKTLDDARGVLKRIGKAKKLSDEDALLVKNADDLSQYLSSIGTSLDAKNEDIKAALDKEARNRSYDQAAYHGTRHLFDKFSTAFMGTGEGAQAYGWGMYFSSSRDVASWYRKQIAGDGFVTGEGKTWTPNDLQHVNVRAAARKAGTDVEAMLARANELLASQADNAQTRPMLEHDIAMLNDLLDQGGITSHQGRLYTVDVPDVEHLMNWDAPYSEQPQAVKDALEKLGVADAGHADMPTQSWPAGVSAILRIALDRADGDPDQVGIVIDNDGKLHAKAKKLMDAAGVDGMSPGDYIEDVTRDYRYELMAANKQTGERIYKELVAKLAGDDPEFLAGSADSKYHKLASEALASAGIPGHRFKGHESGEENYVIYHDDAVQMRSYEQGERGQISIAPDGQAIIRLFEGADLSTFLHESGHFFLNVMQTMAINGESSMVAEMDNVRAWWRQNAADVARDAGKGVTKADVLKAMDEGTTGSAEKDRQIDIGLQEQWARAFEAYLMEGKAPSKELRGAFAKFKAWLLGLYTRLRTLKSNISPEISGVFDRILATQEQIDNARGETGEDLSTFTTAESLGLTPDEFAKLQERRQNAQDDAQRRALAETMEPIRREREKWFKDERAKIEKEVERDVNTYPYYRAFEWLANGRWIGEDAAPQDLPEIRMNRADLIDRFGDGILGQLPKGKRAVYGPDGADPDVIAGWFGYDSGHALVTALQQMPKRQDAIRAETDRRLFELHGDPLNDGSIENIALEAVHGERKGEWLAAELKAVVEVAGAGKATTLADAREAAKIMLAKANLRDAVATKRYLAAERKAAAEASKLARELSADQAWLQMADAKLRAAMKTGTDAQINASIEERNALVNTSTTPFQRAEYQQTRKGVTRTIPAKTGYTTSLGVNDKAAALIAVKNRQLLNHALYQEALKVQEEVRKGENLVNRLGKASTRERIAEAGRRDSAGRPGAIDYLAAIDEVLEQYDFRRSSATADQRRASLISYMEAMKAAGRENELAIPDEVVKNAQRTPYKTLSTDEFRGVIATLDNLEHTAKRWAKAISERDKRTLQETIDGMVGAIAQNVTQRRPGAVETKRERAWNTFKGYLNIAMNASTILREFDGFKDNGPWYEAMKRAIDDAQIKLIERKERAAKDFEKLYSPYSTKERRQMNVREYIPEIGVSLSKWERIAVALNMGNEGNLNRLMARDDNGARVRNTYTASELAAIIGNLDERDADFIQSVWDYIATFQPALAERERRVSGTEPEWVKPSPVEIGGKTLAGGYYPIKYDPRLSGLAADFDIKDLADGIKGGRFGKAQTKNGHLQARVASTNMPLKISMDVFHSHINQVMYDLELSEPVATAWQILQNGQISGLLREQGRAEDFDALQTWLKDVAEGEVRSASAYGRAARMLKNNFTMAKLAFNVGSALVQFTGLSQTFVVAGKLNAVRGIRDTFRPDMVRGIRQKSAFMRSRETTFNKDISDFRISPLDGKIAGRWAEIKNKVIAPCAFFLMQKAQYWTVDVPTWLAGYHDGLAKFNGDERRAIDHADDVVKRVGGSGIFSDRSAMERGSLSMTSRQNDFTRMFTALASYVFAKFNLAYERGVGGARDIANADSMAERLKLSLSLTIDLGLIFAAEAILTAAIRGQLPGDDEDKPEKDRDTWAKFLARETAFSALNTLPLIRDFVPVLQGFQGGGSYGSITDTVGKPLRMTFKGEWERKNYLKSIVDGAGVMTGIPATSVNRLIDIFQAEAQGQDVSPLDAIMHIGGRKLPKQ